MRGNTQATRPRSASFAGQLLLNAFGLSADQLPAGSSLQVATRWQALAAPAADYTLFTHLLGADGSLVSQVDGQPAGSAAASLQGGCRRECWLPACAAVRIQRGDPFLKRAAQMAMPPLEDQFEVRGTADG